MNPDPYPRVGQITDPPTQQTVRLLWERVAALQKALQNSGGSLDVNSNRVINVGTPVAASDAVSKSYADATFLGPGSDSGLLQDFLNAAIGGLMQWLLSHVLPHKTEGSIYTSMTLYTGTLSPNTKPSLGTSDAPSFFYATDFDRLYLWNGTAWNDAPGQDPRNLAVIWPIWTFNNPPNPPKTINPIPTGWALADGSSVTYSTASGGTTAGTAPTVPAGYSLRSSLSSALSTGGSSGPYTSGNNSGTITYRLGDPTGTPSTLTSSGTPHTHDLQLYNPPYVLVPVIVRL